MIEAARLMLNPHPLRTILKRVIRRFRIGTYEQRLRLGVVDRPYYGHCVYNAAVLAKKLGYRQMSVLEFGVAGGSGLVNLEYHAEEISRCLAMDIEIYGFDTGEGLPEPVDFRDIPYYFTAGAYSMDVPKLRARLKKAKLVLGDVKETTEDFFERYGAAPIGAIAFDLDFYSSTVSALRILEGDEENYLPRLFCYFDDTTGTEEHLYSDYTGEKLAINEFNQTHENVKLGLPYYFVARRVMKPWYYRIWICHFFQHSRYNEFIGSENQQLPLVPLKKRT